MKMIYNYLRKAYLLSLHLKFYLYPHLLMIKIASLDLSNLSISLKIGLKILILNYLLKNLIGLLL